MAAARIIGASMVLFAAIVAGRLDRDPARLPARNWYDFGMALLVLSALVPDAGPRTTTRERDPRGRRREGPLDSH
jgi:hypothetical protein